MIADLSHRNRVAGHGNLVPCIATNGVNLSLHHLDNKMQLQCVFVPGTQKALIYRFVDAILRSAVQPAAPTAETEALS